MRHLLDRLARLHLALFVLALAAVPAFAATPGNADTRFEALGQRYVDEFGRYSPVYATALGDHRFDGELDDLGTAGRARAIAWIRDLLA